MSDRLERQKLPDVLSPEWMRQKGAGMVNDLQTLLQDMPPEDAANLASELQKLYDGYKSSKSKDK